jgi:iron complex transport system ATP-binding protein
MRHTLELLNLAAGRVSRQCLVIAVMQDVNLAAMYCDRLICMHAGTVYASGPLEQVLTAPTLRSVFDVHSHVEHNAYSGTLQVAFIKERRL